MSGFQRSITESIMSQSVTTNMSVNDQSDEWYGL